MSKPVVRRERRADVVSLRVTTHTAARIVEALEAAVTADPARFTWALRDVMRNPLTLHAAERRKRISAIARLHGGMRCCYCPEPFTEEDPPTIEHVIPRSRGGTDALENLRLAHQSCNQSRGGTHGEGAHKPGTPSRPRVEPQPYDMATAR